MASFFVCSDPMTFDRNQGLLGVSKIHETIAETAKSIKQASFCIYVNKNTSFEAVCQVNAYCKAYTKVSPLIFFYVTGTSIIAHCSLGSM